MLPKPLKAELEAFARTGLLALSRADPSVILTEIDKLQANSFASAQEAIARAAMLDQRHHLTHMKIVGHRALLRSSPLWAHLFVHHRDGYLREAALDRLDGGARNVFEVMAIAYRLNDWVEPVRNRAEACAWRVFPQTNPDILAAAALILAPRLDRWGRWSRPPAILTVTIGRPDVVSRFATAFLSARSGPMVRLLRDHLRWPTLDDRLVDLAQAAALPGVRSVALQALIEGRVRWQTGWTRMWIDKSRGVFRMIAVYSERDIAQSDDIAALVNRGLRDHAITVRRTAVDGLIRHRDIRADPELIDRLALDPSPSIRERVAYLRRAS